MNKRKQLQNVLLLIITRITILENHEISLGRFVDYFSLFVGPKIK